MSNRTEAEVTFAAELKAAHLAQIEALTAPGLTREERVNRFMDAARFTAEQRNGTYSGGCTCRTCREASAAHLVWRIGTAPFSLFADLPGCKCPVVEVQTGRAKFAGIPRDIPTKWTPTAEQLLPFARIQQERRIG